MNSKNVVVVISLVGVCLSSEAATPSFPLKVSANRRHLVASNETPFLMVGDVAWFLVTNLNKTDTLIYLEDRRVKGYNTILIEAIVNKAYTWNPPYNREGNAPFKTPGDFSTPNDAYFQHLDWVLDRAEERGLLVLLMPCYLGFGSDYWDGWGQEIIKNGPTKNRNYGRFLANRYKSNKNIIWVHGGDNNPPKGSVVANNALEILKGIKDVIPSSLHSFHTARGTNAFEQPTFASYLNVNATYSGDLTYVEALEAYGTPSFGPHFLFEGRYEGKQTWSGGTVNPPELVRAGAYWSQLSGSTGQVSGVMPVFTFGYRQNPGDDNDWRGSLNAKTSYAMGHLRQLFEARAWHLLVPDQGHTTVTSGYGSGHQFVAAARTSDGNLVIAYIPSSGTSSRTITVNMSRLAGPVSAQWMNPTNGKLTAISTTLLPNSGSRSFSTLGNNGSGANDWVLVLETKTPPAQSSRPLPPSDFSAK